MKYILLLCVSAMAGTFNFNGKASVSNGDSSCAFSVAAPIPESLEVCVYGSYAGNAPTNVGSLGAGSFTIPLPIYRGNFNYSLRILGDTASACFDLRNIEHPVSIDSITLNPIKN